MRPLIGPRSIRARPGQFVPNVAFTTAWTATAGTAPAIGNGTLSAAYSLRDGFCKFWLELVGGASTTWGDAGTWRFTAPFAAARDAAGAALVLDNGTAFYAGTPFLASGSASVSVSTNAAGNITFNSPMTWATSDKLVIEMEYPV